MPRFSSLMPLVCGLVLALHGCGGGGGGSTDGATYNPPDSTPTSSTPFTTPHQVSLLAGVRGGKGYLDAAGVAARFGYSSGVAVDSAGNVYVADSDNNAIRKVSPTGLVSTLSREIRSPFGVAVDEAGNVYVTASGSQAIQKISPTGALTLLAGAILSSGHADGVGANASFDTPTGLAIDKSGNLYVADTGNHTIRKITPDGTVSTLAGTAGTLGSADGAMGIASFNRPYGVAVDANGNVLVADTGNRTIRKYTALTGLVETLAGKAGVPGSTDASGSQARFGSPTGVALDSLGNVYVSDASNHTVRKIDFAGTVSTYAGMAGVAGSADGLGAAARFNEPVGMACGRDGMVYIGDVADGIIRKITPERVVSTLAGAASDPGSTDGLMALAKFNEPTGITSDQAGNVYLNDSGNFTVRKIAATGLVSTLAGTVAHLGSTDGSGSAASFAYLAGAATDRAGNIYLGDAGNGTIRKVTPAGVVSTLAGTAGAQGNQDGLGPVASFQTIRGLTVDLSGNVFVADADSHTIRKITPAGLVSTVVGRAGVAGSTDGQGAVARFSGPQGIAADSIGNLYVADSGNNTIRKVSPSGVVSTLAGTPGPSTLRVDGKGSAARFNGPEAVALDSDGNIYVLDTGNFALRQVTPSGVVTTLAVDLYRATAITVLNQNVLVTTENAIVSVAIQ